MRQRTKNLLIVFGVALAAFEIGFQPLPLTISAKPQAQEDGAGFVRTLTYHFDNNVVGITPKKPPQAADEPAPSDEGDEADAEPVDDAEAAVEEDAEEATTPLTRDDIIKEVRGLLEAKGVLIEDVDDAITLPADNRVAIKVRLPNIRPRPGSTIPDENALRRFRRVALDTLNEEYADRAGQARLVVESKASDDKVDANLLAQLGPIRIERPRPRIKLGLDLQGGVRTVLECVPVATFRYTAALPISDDASSSAASEADDDTEAVDTDVTGEPASEDASEDAPADSEPAKEKTDWQTVATAVGEALEAQGATVDDAIALERGIGITVRLTDTRDAAEADLYQAVIEEAIASFSPEAMVLDDRTDVLLGSNTIDSVRNVVQRRVDGLGLTEPVIQTEGEQRLIVEIPGQQPEEDIIQPADLKFVQADLDKYEFGKTEVVAPSGKQIEKVLIRDKRTNDPVEHKVFLSDPTTELAFSGADLKDNCQAQPDQQSAFWQVSFEFKPDKREEFRAYTARHVGDPLLIVLNDEVLMYPTIRSAIGGSGVIEGQFTADEANELAVFLNAGALPIPLEIIEAQQVSATLGQASIDRSVKAGLLGFLVVVLFMIFYYRLPGLIADLALGIYLLFVVAAMVMLDATLTLHGIAGLILTVGIAVDANVLIFERLKEELRTGKSMRMAMEAAFSRAWTAIVDSNVTTILAGVALLIFGTGGIKGFAICLIVGTLCSMVSAVTITKLLLSTAVHTRLANTSWLFLGAKGGR